MALVEVSSEVKHNSIMGILSLSLYLLLNTGENSTSSVEQLMIHEMRSTRSLEASMSITTLLLLIPLTCFLLRARKFFFLLIFSGYFVRPSCSFDYNILSVVSDNRDHTISCDHNEIFTINVFCEESAFHSDTVVTFLSGQHQLNSTCELQDLRNVTLIGQSGTKVMCSATEESGFRFINVRGLTIANIEFEYCGFTYNVTLDSLTHLLLHEVLTALFFLNGSNLTLEHVLVMNAKSAGIVIYSVAGNVHIDSTIIRNASSDDLEMLSGNIIAYNYQVRESTHVHISNSQFISSGYINSKKNCLFARQRLMAYSCGLSLFLGSFNLTLQISNTRFLNNTGCYGGNMAILLLEYAQSPFDNPMIVIQKTSFCYGKAYTGGGLYVTFENSFSATDNAYFSNNSAPLSILNIVDSNFVGNYAKRNGGGVYLQWKRSRRMERRVDSKIISSEFSDNSIGLNGSGGLALHYQTYIDYTNDPHVFPKYRVNLNLTNSTFHNHYPDIMSQQFLSESSVILVNLAPYLGIDGVRIISNNCTALLAVGSTLVFYSDTKISNNAALAGAGIRLCSRSIMYLTPNTKLAITNNSATETGGGILVNSNCLVNTPMCFYQYSPEVTFNLSLLETINVIVKDNIAPKGGNNIYGGSFDYCYLLLIKWKFEFQFQFNIPNNTVNQPSSISSNPQHVCFREIEGDMYYCNKHKNESIYPGQKVTYSFHVVGQQQGSVTGTVLASTSGGASIDISDFVKAVNISRGNLTYTIYSTGTDEKNAELKFQAVHEYVHQFLPATVHIKILDCPLGFRKMPSLKGGDFSCKCSRNHGHYNCSR